MQCSPITWLQFCLDQGLPIQCSEKLEPFITVNPVPKPRQKWSAQNQSQIPLPEHHWDVGMSGLEKFFLFLWLLQFPLMCILFTHFLNVF